MAPCLAEKIVSFSSELKRNLPVCCRCVDNLDELGSQRRETKESSGHSVLPGPLRIVLDFPLEPGRFLIDSHPLSTTFDRFQAFTRSLQEARARGKRASNSPFFRTF
jgi:hypothetical protein